MENKIDKTEDIEERGAFTSLLTTIQEVMERVKAMEGEQMQVEDDREATIEEISARMREVQLGHEIVKGSMEKKEDSVFAVKEDKRKTFLSILQKFQQIPVDKTLLQIVEQYYDLCDYEFMETLAKEATDCEQLNNAEDADKYRTLIATINEVMLKKVGSAQQKLQRILSRKELKLMEAEAALLTRKGEADEALVLLIEANAQQAKQAGALPAYEILTKIAKKIIYEQERRLPEEQQLLRALMRLEDSEQRKGLLYDAFKPRKDTNENAEIIELPPTIAPPVFINIVRQFIRNFGNIDGFQIMDRALAIIDEAQVVATEFYGEGMNAQQQQKYMFEKNTVSVWDLGNYEDQALLSGEEIPWENNAFDNKGPEDVVGERVKSIGGIHDSL